MYYLCFNMSDRIEFSSAGRFIAEKEHIHPKRKIDSAVLLLGYKGSCPIAQENREYCLTRGSFVLLFPNTLHYGTDYAETGQSHFWCHFNLPEGFYIAEAENANELQKEGFCVIPEFAEITDCEKYFVLFSQLIDESENLFESGIGSVICGSYLKILLCSLADKHLTANSKKRVITAKIREWIYTNSDKEPTVCEIASSLNYNPHYLTKLVKEESGMTFIGYINYLKLKKAKNLLINSDMKICEIAFSTGFADEKYFAKVFRKYEKMTPKQYRYTYFRKNINKV